MSNVQIAKEYQGLKFLSALTKDPLHFFTSTMNKHGSHVWMKIRGKPLLMLNDATGIQYILETNTESFRKGRFHQFLKPIFGDSIFLSEGETWRKQRRNAAPVFANRNYEDWVTQMVAAIEAMFKRWDKDIEQNKPIDFALEMTSFTLDVLLRSLFHEVRDEVATDMRSTLDVILTDTEKRVWSAFNLPTFIAHNLPRYFKANKFLHSLVESLITTRQADQAYPDDLLSTLIKHYGLENDREILHDEVLAYFLSGHDTTAHGLAWAFYMLALHPEHQNKIADEVESILGDKIPTSNDLKKLQYTRQVFDESLRLYPPVWSISREVAQDDEIPLDNGSKIAVSVGQGIMLCHYAVHRRPKYWANPEAFDPNRFAPEKYAQRQPFTWFPFGGGKRMCIGFRLAQMESLIALSMITQRYTLSLLPGQNITPKPIITLRPSGPILFEVNKRRNGMQKAPGYNVQETKITLDAAEQEAEHLSGCPFHKVA